MCVSFLIYGDSVEKYMEIALKEAKKALKHNDVPIGAVIVENGKIISRGHNKKERKHSATKHAEIIAIEKACKRKKSWYLNECTLYVTIEPCMMCCGAIIQSRINKIVYGSENEKFGYITSIDSSFSSKKNNHSVKIESGILRDECRKLIKDFFKEKRK